MAKTMTRCVETNDLYTAADRYNETSPNWKKRWWATCLQIFNAEKEKWSKIFFVDIKNKIIHTIETNVKAIIKKSTISLSERWCYVIRIFKNGVWLFDKIGTFNGKNPKSRWSNIIKKGWSGIDSDGLSYEVISLYNCGGRHPEGQESDFRSKLIQEYDEFYIPNDRFKVHLDKNYLDAWAKSYGSTIVI